MNELQTFAALWFIMGVLGQTFFPKKTKLLFYTCLISTNVFVAADIARSMIIESLKIVS